MFPLYGNACCHIFKIHVVTDLLFHDGAKLILCKKYPNIKNGFCIHITVKIGIQLIRIKIEILKFFTSAFLSLEI